MNKMQIVEKRLRNSFHFVQNDIISLENRQQELLERVERIERLLMRQAFKPVNRQTAAYLVGNRDTREIHAADCILAKSMDMRSQIAFDSKHAALRAGFSECICLG